MNCSYARLVVPFHRHSKLANIWRGRVNCHRWISQFGQPKLSVLECRIIVPVLAPTGSKLSLPCILPILLHRMLQRIHRKSTAGHLPDVRHVLWDSSHICIVTTMFKHIVMTLVTPHIIMCGGGGGRVIQY